MADAHFEVPRLAEIYDPLDSDRSDLDAYATVAGEFGARAVLDIGGTGTFACLGSLVCFRTTFVFDGDGAVLASDSTLRFRGRSELADSLTAAGFVVDEVRDAPDRPGLEFVFIARKSRREP